MISRLPGAAGLLLLVATGSLAGPAGGRAEVATREEKAPGIERPASPGNVPPGGPELPALPADELRYQSLSDSLTRRTVEWRGKPDLDDVPRMEAEGIAGIAEEFLEEGDPATAIALLEEALAILDPAPGE